LAAGRSQERRAKAAKTTSRLFPVKFFIGKSFSRSYSP
jgi:hypothetical protein